MFGRNFRMSTSILHRYLLAFILVFCTGGLYAQSDRVQLFNDALMSKDVEICKRLIPLITQEDIDYMADSTLLYYYYWASRCASENDQIEESIVYLIEAKELCEAKTGIHNQLYFDVILTLGETCEKKGDEDEALLWYEEGIVKAFPFQNYEEETLVYINRIRNNAADIFETKGHPDMARYLRPSDNEGSFY